MAQPPDAATLGLPRILCLHVGGVNADVFRMHARAIVSGLAPYFRLVFVDGPFLCAPFPGITTVYGDYGPFRRWLRWLPEHPEVDAETAASEMAYQVRSAMEDDDALGGRGDWVGLMGFSQGAKVAASMLYTQQVAREKKIDAQGRLGGVEGGGGGGEAGKESVNWRFGVLMAGRAPLVLLDEKLGPLPQGIADASMGSTTFTDWPDGSGGTAHLLRAPTIHVHGLKDQGLHHHLKLLNVYCAPGTTRLVQWDGDHRLPIRTNDVEAVTSQIIELGKELGILKS